MMISSRFTQQLCKQVTAKSQQFSTKIDHFLSGLKTQVSVKGSLSMVESRSQDYKKMTNSEKISIITQYKPTSELPLIYTGSLLRTPSELVWSSIDTFSAPSGVLHKDMSAIQELLIDNSYLKAGMIIEERGAFYGDLSVNLLIAAEKKDIHIPGLIISDINTHAIQIGRAFSTYLGLDRYTLQGLGNAVSTSKRFPGGKCLIANKVLTVMSLKKGREFLESCRDSMTAGDILVVNIAEKKGLQYEQKTIESEQGHKAETQSLGISFKSPMLDFPNLPAAQTAIITALSKKLDTEGKSLTVNDFVQHTTFHIPDSFEKMLNTIGFKVIYKAPVISDNHRHLYCLRKT